MKGSRFIYGEDARLLAWASARMPTSPARYRDDACAIGHEIDGKIRGVFVYDTFGYNSCHVHVASDHSWRWLPKEFAIVAMAFPFIQCGFGRIMAPISVNNAPSLKLARRFGGIEEGRLRRAGPQGEDLVIMGVLREECPFVPPFRNAGVGAALAL